MFCSNCGSQNDPSTRFCAYCGTEIASAQQPVNSQPQESSQPFIQPQMPQAYTPQPEAPQAYAPQPEVPQAYAPQPEVPQAYAPQPQYDGNQSTYIPLDPNAQYEQVPAKPKKKAKKGLIALVASFLVVAVIGGVTLLNLQKIKMAVMGQERYYALAEKKFIEEESEDFLKLLKTMTEVAYSSKTELGLEIDGDAGMDSSVLDAISKVKLNIESSYDPKVKKGKTQLEAIYDGDSIITILQQEAENRMGISFPGLSDDQIVGPSFRWVNDILLGNEAELKKMTGLSKQERKKLSSELYKKIVIDSIPKSNVSTGKDEYHGKKYTSTTFTIDQKVATKMAKSFANELEKNKTLRKAIKNSYEYLKENEKDYLEVMGYDEAIEEIDILEELDKTAADIKEELEKDDDDDEETDTTVEFTVLYDQRGRIVARKISVSEKDSDDDTNILIGKYKNNGSDIFEVVVTSNGSKVSVINESKTSNGNVVGKIYATSEQAELDYDDDDDDDDEKSNSELFRLDYKYKKGAKINSVPVFVGEITTKIEVPLYGDIEVIYKSEMKGSDTIDFSFEVKTPDTNVKLKGTTQILGKPDLSDVSVPKESTFNEKSMEDVQEKMSEKLIDIIGGNIGGDYEDYEDDDGDYVINPNNQDDRDDPDDEQLGGADDDNDDSDDEDWDADLDIDGILDQLEKDMLEQN